ncbi:MAG: hypothetical protein ACLR0N_15545 [Bilophila wadsworthia]
MRRGVEADFQPCARATHDRKVEVEPCRWCRRSARSRTGCEQPRRVQRVSHPVKAEVHVKEPEGVEMILYVVERVEAHYHAFAVGWVMDAGRRPAGAARDGPASSAWGRN